MGDIVASLRVPFLKKILGNDQHLSSPSLDTSGKMTIPTIHTHCRHSNTADAHDDCKSMCSDMLDKLSTNPFWTQKPAIRPNASNAGLRLPQTLSSIITKERQEKNKRLLFVNNLDPSISINDLERAFSNHGPISKMTIHRKYHETTGHGILEFADSNAKCKATVVHGTRIGPRPVLVASKHLTNATHGCSNDQGRRQGHGQGCKNGRLERGGSGVGPRRTSLRDITNAHYPARPY